MGGLPNPAETETVIVTFDEFLLAAVGRYLMEPDWRWGQAIFNVLCEMRPDLSEQIRGTDFDPFYDNSDAKEALRWIRSHIGP